MIEDDLLEYIGTEIAYDRSDGLTADDPLIEGVLDSLGVLKLVSFVEERYQVKIEDSDLLPSNFATAATLADLLREKGVS
jgi:acyl carrier protein